MSLGSCTQNEVDNLAKHAPHGSFGYLVCCQSRFVDSLLARVRLSVSSRGEAGFLYHECFMFDEHSRVPGSVIQLRY